MTDRERAIAGSTLFRGLSVEQCAPFVPLAREQAFSKGATLFRLGEEAGLLFVVRSGIVHLTMPLAMPGGDHEMVVQEAHERDTVAWSALIEPYRYTMSGRAGTDVTLLGFAPDRLQEAMAAHPAAGQRMLTNLAQVIARRLQVMQAMWTRELQRTVTVTLG